MAVTITNEGIETKFGKLTTDKADFGYGWVWLECGEIVYQDSCGYKSWKSVSGFERWADRQNAMCNGIYNTIKG